MGISNSHLLRHINGKVNAEVVQVAEGLKFTWDISYLTSKEKTQRVMLMAYFPLQGVAVYQIQGEQRWLVRMCCT